MIDSYLMTLPESESAECQILYNYKIYIYSNESLIIVSHVRMYSGEGGGGVLWLSRRYAAASADIYF